MKEIIEKQQKQIAELEAALITIAHSKPYHLPSVLRDFAKSELAEIQEKYK